MSAKERAARADALLSLVKLDRPATRRSGSFPAACASASGWPVRSPREPHFLLMDEPLGALDALTRERMQTTLLDIWAANSVGILMITHGIEEALLLGTRVVVLTPGPGRIVRRFDTGFGARYVGRRAGALDQGDPAFVAARAELSDAIFEGELA